jgi:hypothetical protein
VVNSLLSKVSYKSVLKKLIPGLILAGAVFGTVALIQTNPWLHQQWVLSTTQQPDRLTELYFDNPNALPKVTWAGKTEHVSYHVHNLESRTTTYTARVNLVVNGQIQTIQQNQFVLPNDGQLSIPVTYTPSAKNQHLQLSVDLLGQNESITFRSST